MMIASPPPPAEVLNRTLLIFIDGAFLHLFIRFVHFNTAVGIFFLFFFLDEDLCFYSDGLCDFLFRSQGNKNWRDEKKNVEEKKQTNKQTRLLDNGR